MTAQLKIPAAYTVYRNKVAQHLFLQDIISWNSIYSPAEADDEGFLICSIIGDLTLIDKWDKDLEPVARRKDSPSVYVEYTLDRILPISVRTGNSSRFVLFDTQSLMV